MANDAEHFALFDREGDVSERPNVLPTAASAGSKGSPQAVGNLIPQSIVTKLCGGNLIALREILHHDRDIGHKVRRNELKRKTAAAKLKCQFTATWNEVKPLL